MDKSIFEKSTKVFTSNNENSKELKLVKSSKKVQYYFDMLDTFEGEERMNKSSGRPFSEFKEEYLKNRTKK
jgi:hypothetical protein